MIIKLLLDLVYNVFNVLTLPIKIPVLPSQVSVHMGNLIGYVSSGLAILGNFVNLSLLLKLFGIIVAVDVGMWLYNLVMFFVKKIPMLNVR